MAYNSTTQAIFNNAIEQVFNSFEEEILYGDYRTTAIIRRISEDEKQAGLYNYDAEITMKKNDVLIPSNGDEIWIDDKIYKIGKIIKEDLNYWILSSYYYKNIHSRQSKEWR